MLDLLRDLRHGLRAVARQPGFALTAIFTLALGIGATTALFTVVNAVILSPLPFPDSHQLVQVWRSELPSLTYGSASYGRYLDWRREQRAFTDLGAWAPRGLTIGGGDGPERVGGATASASFFRVIAAPAVAGRYFADDEDQRGGPKVTVISERLWQRRFQGSASAIGSTLQIDGEPHIIVGIAPSGFSETWRLDVWIPLGAVADASNRQSNYLLSFGRMPTGMIIDRARRSLEALAQQMTREHPEDKYTFTARSLHEIITEGATRGLWVLLGATALLLLIACTNVANLLLARAVVRERDLAIRASLGAGRRRLVSQVLGETVALGVLGSLAGVGLAWALIRMFVSMAPPNFPRLAAIAVDVSALWFSLGVAMAAGLLAGLAPALHLLRSDLNTVIRSGDSRGATARRARSASRLLVVSEVALALALVTTASLMVKSLLRLQSQNLGFTREPVLTFGVGLPPLVANGSQAVARFQTEFRERVRAVPSVTHVSAINMLPIAATGSNGWVRREDQSGEREGVPVTEYRTVMDDYFETMGVRLLAGRTLGQGDREGAVPVAVVNEALASRLWPERDAARVVGQRIRLGTVTGATSEVIGVVANVRSRRPDAPPDPEVYQSFLQLPSPTMSYVVRAVGDPAALTGQIRAALEQMTPHVALAAVRTFDNVVTTSTQTSGLLSMLSVIFGVLAATLAIVGIYSVMSYTVAQRTRELAIRSAIGATRGTLLGVVVREGLTLCVVGIVAGELLAFATSGVLSALLYEVRATDPFVFATSALGLALTAVAGYLIPALRASRVEPVTALRGE